MVRFATQKRVMWMGLYKEHLTYSDQIANVHAMAITKKQQRMTLRHSGFWSYVQWKICFYHSHRNNEQAFNPIIQIQTKTSQHLQCLLSFQAVIKAVLVSDPNSLLRLCCYLLTINKWCPYDYQNGTHCREFTENIVVLRTYFSKNSEMNWETRMCNTGESVLQVWYHKYCCLKRWFIHSILLLVRTQKRNLSLQ